jgi:hypothetical protein
MKGEKDCELSAKEIMCQRTSSNEVHCRQSKIWSVVEGGGHEVETGRRRLSMTLSPVYNFSHCGRLTHIYNETLV